MLQKVGEIERKKLGLRAYIPIFEGYQLWYSDMYIIQILALL